MNSAIDDMKVISYQGVDVVYSPALDAEEVKKYVADQMQYQREHRLPEMASCKVLLLKEPDSDGLQVEIRPRLKSSIVRIRRITGYVSRTDNWNQAKQAELHDRVAHVSIR